MVTACGFEVSPSSSRCLSPAPLGPSQWERGLHRILLVCVLHAEAGKTAQGWQTAPGLAASPLWPCLRSILSAGLLVTSPSRHQCLGLAQLYARRAVSFHTGEPAKSLPGVIVTSQQRFANRHSEIKSWCRVKGQ